MPWHTKKPVTPEPPKPPPACAPVADSAKAPTTASTLATTLLFTMFPPWLVLRGTLCVEAEFRCFVGPLCGPDLAEIRARAGKATTIPSRHHVDELSREEAPELARRSVEEEPGHDAELGAGLERGRRELALQVLDAVFRPGHRVCDV